MTNITMLLRWSFRDLKERKFQVIAISLIIGLGTGAYVGLSSTTPWRQHAFDESNRQLNMYDLKLELSQQSWVNQTWLDSTVKNLPHTDWITAFELRTVFPTFVNASTASRSAYSLGRLIGIDVSNGSENIAVNGIHITKGDHIEANSSGHICIVEFNFAKYYDLNPGQNISIAGGLEFNCTGTGQSPEYFIIIEGGAMMNEAAFCALFIPITTAQQIVKNQTGFPGEPVNEAVFLLSPAADRNVLQTEIETAFAVDFSSIDVKFTLKEDDPVYSLLLNDIPGDQSMYTFLSFLFILIAAFGTYNLVSRVVSSQRRQIGINMAQGVPPHQIAYRYLLFSLEIAIGGVITGFFLAVITGKALSGVVAGFLPLPVWEEWLVVDLFMQGALLGTVVPFLACIIPVWRATRVPPIDAIQTSNVVSTGKGAASLLERIRLPGTIFVQLPFRNLARNLRRTFSTALGIALAICLLVTVLGFIDGTNHLIVEESNIIEGHSPGRIEVTMNNLYNASEAPVTSIIQHPDLEMAVPGIRVPVKMHHSSGSFPIVLYFIDLQNEIWSPEPLEASTRMHPTVPGIILPRKVASDLNAGVGDLVRVEHLFRESSYQYSQKNSSFEVIGVQESNIRFWAFVDITDSEILNCQGLINYVMITPKLGITSETIQREFFKIHGVSGVQPITRFIETYKELIDTFGSVLGVIQHAVFFLALLLAYNTTSINIDERARELATMSAFGTPIRTITSMLIVENVSIGIIGTAIGYFPLGIIVTELFQLRVESFLPEVNLTSYIFPQSHIVIIGIGIVLVALIPLLTARKLIKMDLPSTLRVIE